MSAKKPFGQKIVSLRMEQGVSQEELAFRVGVSVMTVRRWEHGRNGPEFDRLEKIAKAFGISLEELFKGL